MRQISFFAGVTGIVANLKQKILLRTHIMALSKCQSHQLHRWDLKGHIHCLQLRSKLFHSVVHVSIFFVCYNLHVATRDGPKPLVTRFGVIPRV